MRRSRADARHRPGAEAGITIVETMIAASVLLIVLLAGFLSLESASSATKTAERQAIAASVGEREIERMQAMPYDQIVHCEAPRHEPPGAPAGEVPENPNFYVKDPQPASGEDKSRFRVMTDYRVAGSEPLAGTPSDGEVLVISASQPCDASTTAAVSADPVPFQSGEVAGQVYRFVSWREETCAPDLPGDLDNLIATPIMQLVSGLLGTIRDIVGSGVDLFCTQPHDTKRLTVAVVVDDAGEFGPHKPTWISTVTVDPNGGLIVDT